MMKKIAPLTILFSTGILILAVAIKVIIGQVDMLDRLTALLAVVLFFFDQITR